MIQLREYLQLERPLAVLDLETTGFNHAENDRVVQIAITMHYPDKEPIRWVTLVNPLMPIANSTTHGINDERVADAPKFISFAAELARRITLVDICAYNGNFDIDFLRSEFKRCNVDWPWVGCLVDPFRIYQKKLPHNLTNAYREYGGPDGNPLPPDTTLEGAHDAGVDVSATEVVLRGQLLRHADLQRTVKALADFCDPPKPNAIDRKGRFVWHKPSNTVVDVCCMAFGKYFKNNGNTPQPLSDIVKKDRRYIEYMVGIVSEPDVKKIMQDALAGSYPTVPGEDMGPSPSTITAPVVGAAGIAGLNDGEPF